MWLSQKVTTSGKPQTPPSRQVCGQTTSRLSAAAQGFQDQTGNRRHELTSGPYQQWRAQPGGLMGKWIDQNVSKHILFSPLWVTSIPTLATMPFTSEKYPKPAYGTDGCYWWADPRSLETQRERVSGWGLLWQKQSGVERGSLATSPQPSPARVSAFARASVLFSGPAVTRAPNFTAVQFQIVLLFPSCSAILLEFVCHQL